MSKISSKKLVFCALLLVPRHDKRAKASELEVTTSASYPSSKLFTK